MDTNLEGGDGAGEGIVDAERRAELLKKGWALLAARDYRGIQALLEPLPEEVVVGEPELGFLLAAAWHRLKRLSDSLALIRAIGTACAKHSNRSLARERTNLEGALLLLMGQYSEADRCFASVLESALDAGDAGYEAAAYNNLGITADIRCDHLGALTQFQRSLSIARAHGLSRIFGNALQNVAFAYRSLGMLSVADVHIVQARKQYESHGSIDEIIAADIERALVLSKIGDLRLATITAKRAYQDAVEHGLSRSKGEILRVFGVIAMNDQNWAAARAHLVDSLEISRSTSNPLLEAEVLEEMAVLAQAEGDEAEMRRRLEESAAIYERIGTPARAQRARDRLFPAAAGDAYA